MAQSITGHSLRFTVVKKRISQVLTYVLSVLRTSFLFQQLLLLGLWLLVWHIGRLVEYTEHASVWFPAAGFTFAALFVLGLRAIPSIFSGAIIITIWSGFHYQLSLDLKELIWGGVLFACAHIIPYWLGALSFKWILDKNSWGLPQLVVGFLLIAGLSSFITTLSVVTSLVESKLLPASDVADILLPFWIGDLAGIIVLSPLFLVFLYALFPNVNLAIEDFKSEQPLCTGQAFYKITLSLVLIFFSMLLACVTKTPESAYAVFFVTVPHMWTASTENPVINTISLGLSSFFIALLVHMFQLMDFVMTYQFAICVIAANSLFGMALPQLTAANQKLKDKVFIDSLTKASSRDYLMNIAQQEIENSHTKQNDLSLIVFDIDHFKRVNDTLGHAVGDIALKRVSHAAKHCLRSNDVLARFGGDEFVILLPNTNKRRSYQIAQRIRKTINNINLNSTNVSSSFGVAQLVAEESFDQLFTRADSALYLSKQKGRNQVNINE